MLACPACGAALDLTSAACSCGADARAAFDGVWLVCSACEGATPAGSPRCVACGEPLGTGTAAAKAPAVEAAGPPVLQRTGRPRLRVVAAGGEGSPIAVALGSKPVLCGRSDGDLVVGGDTVSRHHARFTVLQGVAWVEDLGSLNGTWLRLRAPRALALGGELRVGDRRLRLAWTPAGAALEEIATGGALVATHRLRAGATVLGRRGDIAFPDAALEEQHARLESTQSGLTAVDLGSAAGTWARLAAPEPVVAGDQILLGGELVRVEAIPP